jgi:hypothetical protein
MAPEKPYSRCIISILPDPSQHCWHVRVSIDQVVVASLGLQTDHQLTREAAHGMFHAVCGEIAATLF